MYTVVSSSVGIEHQFKKCEVMPRRRWDNVEQLADVYRRTRKLSATLSRAPLGLSKDCAVCNAVMWKVERRLAR